MKKTIVKLYQRASICSATDPAVYATKHPVPGNGVSEGVFERTGL